MEQVTERLHSGFTWRFVCTEKIGLKSEIIAWERMEKSAAIDKPSRKEMISKALFWD